MDYSKILHLQRSNNLSNAEMGKIAGYDSDNGYTRMLRAQSLRVDSLVMICKHFDLPLTYFIPDTPKETMAKEPKSGYGFCYKCEQKEGQIALLKEQLELKEQEIRKLIQNQRAYKKRSAKSNNES